MNVLSRNERNSRAIIRIYGTLNNGKSILVHISGFCPYFYVKAWPLFRQNIDENIFRKALESAIITDQYNNKKSDIYVIQVMSVLKKRHFWI